MELRKDGPLIRRAEPAEVQAAARRRLEVLGRELENAGVRPRAEVSEPLAPEPVIPRPSGRHSRRRPLPMSERAGGWVQDRIPATLRGRVQLGRAPILLLLALAVVVVVAAFLTVQRMGGGVQQVPAVAVTTPRAAAPSSTPSSAPSPTTTVIVDVAGKVRRPGVVSLPSGARVIDAIKQAGGTLPGTRLDGLNQARVLADGEQVFVGKPPGGKAAAAVTAPGAAPGGNLVSLNTATQEQLETLPGVGPVTAQSILQWRTTHGSFSAVDELLEVDGIGDKTLAKLAPLVTL